MLDWGHRRWTVGLLLALAVALVVAVVVPARSGHGVVRRRREQKSGSELIAHPSLEGAASASIGQSERDYWVRGLRAANPGQRLALRFTHDGVAVQTGSATLGLGLAGLTGAGISTPVALGAPHVIANRVSYAGRGVSEWFVNGPLGLEQGFQVTRPPSGDGSLTLGIALSPGTVPALTDSTNAELRLAGGSVVRYGDLSAVDATGHSVPARFTLTGRNLSIDVQDAGARFPITVDPLVQQQVLIGSSAGTGANQGYSVALSGDGNTAAVGAPGDSSGLGAVWTFTLSGSTWTQDAMVNTPQTNVAGAFGTSVALDNNGLVMIVGAPANDSAYVYEYDSGTATWNLDDTLSGTSTSEFGESVALSGNGAEAIVGAPNALVTDSPSTGRFGLVAFVSAPVVQSSGDVTYQNGPTGQLGFGQTVAISEGGTVAVIGNPNDGVVWTSQLTDANTGTWSTAAELPDSCEAASTCLGFGSSVAVSGDGDVVLAGANGSRSGDGDAWVYSGTPGDYGTPTELYGDCAAASCSGPAGTGENVAGQFGSSVSLSDDGDTALIGAPDDGGAASSSDTGAAWEFTDSGGTWSQDGSKLVGDCTTNCTNQGTTETDGGEFGASVALAGESDGTELLVGAPDNDDGSGATGAAWTFTPGSAGQTATSTSLSVPSQIQAGQSTTLTATVSPRPDGGDVSFTENGQSIAACTAQPVSSSGTATCTTSFPVAETVQLVASYTGDTNFAASSSAPQSATIGAGPTSTVITTASTTVAAGAQVSFTATVSPNPEGGTVSWFVNGSPITCESGSSSLSGAVATCLDTFMSAGSEKLQAKYTGDADYTSSSSNTLTDTVTAPFDAALVTSAGTGSAETIYSTPCGSAKVEVQLSNQTDSSEATYTMAATGDITGLSLTPRSGSITHDGTVTLTLKDTGQNSGTALYVITVKDPSTGYTDALALTVSHAHLPVAQGVWVTQGIQPDYNGLDPSGDGASGDLYQGVELVAGKTTIVRLYANAPNSPGGLPVQAELYGYGPGHHPLPRSPITSGPATLPDLGSAAGAHDSVTRAELLSNANAFTFTLPTSWVTGGGNGSLPGPTADEFVGKVLLQDASAPSDGQCEGSDSFALTAVGFLQVDNLYHQYDNNPALTIVPMKVNGSKPVPGATALEYPDAVFPLNNGALGTGAWAKGIDISDIADGPAPAKGQPSKTSLAMARLEQTFPNQAANHIHTVGMTSDANDFGRGLTNGNGNGFSYYSVVAFNPFTFGGNRPLTTLSHEIGHQFGLEHASEECGGEAGGGGVPWVPTETFPGEATPLIDPTDGTGTLDGIGLNTTSEPYQFVADGATETLSAPAGYNLSPSTYTMSTSGSSQAYDFMSYCTPERGGDDAGNWLSPQYWTHMIFNFNNNPGGSWYTSENGGPPTYLNGSFYSTIVPNGPFPDERTLERSRRINAARIARAEARSEAESDPLAATATLVPSRLDVLAIAQGAGVSASGAVTSSASVSIASVFPQVGTALPNGSTGDSFTLTALGATGQAIESVPMSAQDGHIDEGPASHGSAATPGQVVDILSANVPATGVDSLQLSAGGQVVATEKKPAKAPTVTVTAPRRGQRVGAGKNVVLRWRATDPEHLKLLAFIDYSQNGGRSWRTIYSGPNTGSDTLPSFWFTASKRARIRVRISDGWNQPSALSPMFVAVGAPPQVTILTQIAKRMKIAGDAETPLTGQAVDQSMQSLTGRHLVWYDGPFELGTGTSIESGPLPAGVEYIRLVARDPQGRTASASLTLDVAALKLSFLKLTVPARAKRTAKSVTLTASSTIPATLTVGRRHVTLKPRHKTTLTIPITRGRTPLLLEPTITAAGATTHAAYVVTR